MLELPRATAHRLRLARPFSSFAGIILQVLGQVDKIGSISALISAKRLIRLANMRGAFSGFGENDGDMGRHHAAFAEIKGITRRA